MGKLYIRKGGFRPSHGNANIAYSGVSVLYDGERRVGSSRGNAVFEVVYTTLGDNVLDLQAAQDQIAIMSEQVRLRAEKGIGEPVRFKYRMPDGLDDVPDPIIGEWSRYYELIDLEPQLPETLYDLARGNVVEAIVARITAQPLAEGVPQPAFNCTVDVKTEAGFLVTRGYINLINNPDFVYTSVFADQWAIAAALSGVIDQAVYPKNNTKSARFSNPTAGALDITQVVASLSGSSTPYNFGVICRRNDGGAVSAGQVTLLAAGGVVSGVSFVQIPFTDWYLVFGTFSATTSVTVGIRIAANTIINVGSVVMCVDSNDNIPPLYISGDMPGAYWGGTTPRLKSGASMITVQGQSMSAKLGPLDLMGDFSISFMSTMYFESNATYAGIGAVPFVYYIAQTSALNFVRFYYDRTNRRFTLLKNVAGTNYSFNYSRNIVFGETLYFTITQSGTTLRLYLNGVSVGSVECPYFASTGANLFYMAGLSAVDMLTGQYALDGVKVWDNYALGQAEITAAYTMQSTRKLASGLVELPATLWTNDGQIYTMIDGAVNEYRAQFYNYAILSVPGTAPAKVDLVLNINSVVIGPNQYNTVRPPSGSLVMNYKIGLWPETGYKNNGRLHWSEIALSGNQFAFASNAASRDFYRYFTLSTLFPNKHMYEIYLYNDQEEAGKILKGSYSIFGRMSGNQTGMVFYSTPFYTTQRSSDFDASPYSYGMISGKRKLITTLANGLNYLGEISIEDAGQNAVTWGVYIEQYAGTLIVPFDYMVLLPKDFLLTVNTVGEAGFVPERLRVNDDVAQLELNGAMARLCNREGPLLRAWPGIQNTLMVIFYADSWVVGPDYIGEPRLTITPRYTD